MNQNMDQRYAGHGVPGMLEPQHKTMSDVVLYATERAIAETSLSHDKLAGCVMRAYEDQVDEGARTVKVNAPRLSQDHDTYSARDRAAQTRLKRYRDGDQPVPADMVLPWLSELPGRYGQWGRETIARMMGFLGAVCPSADGAGPDCNLLTEISNGSSQAMRLIVQALADGRLDEQDAEIAPDLYAALHDLIAKAVAAQARLCARTGYEPKTARPALSVVDGGGVAS